MKDKNKILKNIEKEFDGDEGYKICESKNSKYTHEFKEQEVWVNDKDKIIIEYVNQICPYDSNGNDMKLIQNIESKDSSKIVIKFDRKYLLYAISILWILINATDTGGLDFNDFNYNPITKINGIEIPIKWDKIDNYYEEINDQLFIKEKEFIKIIKENIENKNEFIITNKSIHDIYTKAIYFIRIETPYFEHGYLSSKELNRIYKK